jgi:multiple sugar transport system ATP-binding protein
MKDGLIQQVDTPQNLYDYPRNTFVASFIGAPPMNFLNAAVIKTEGGYKAKIENTLLPILEDKASAKVLEAYVGKEITIGIRPEDLHAEQAYIEKQDTVALIEVMVDLAELMGSEIFVYGSYADSNLIAKIPPRVFPKAGENLKLAIDCTKLHIFDSDTGEVIK